MEWKSCLHFCKHIYLPQLLPLSIFQKLSVCVQFYSPMQRSVTLTKAIPLSQQILQHSSRNAQDTQLGQICPPPSLARDRARSPHAAYGQPAQIPMVCCPQKPGVLMCRSTDFGVTCTGQLPCHLGALQKTNEGTPLGALLTVSLFLLFCLVLVF